MCQQKEVTFFSTKECERVTASSEEEMGCDVGSSIKLKKLEASFYQAKKHSNPCDKRLDLPVTICSSADFLSFFLKQKSPRALDNAKLPKDENSKA